MDGMNDTQAHPVTVPITSAEAPALCSAIDSGDVDLLLAYGRLQAPRTEAREDNLAWWSDAPDDLDGELTRDIARRLSPLLDERQIDRRELSLAAMLTCCADQYPDAMITVQGDDEPDGRATRPVNAFDEFRLAIERGQGTVRVKIDHHFFDSSLRDD